MGIESALSPTEMGKLRGKTHSPMPWGKWAVGEKAASTQEHYGEVGAGWGKPGVPVLGPFASHPPLARPLLCVAVFPWLPAHSAKGKD